MTIGFMSDVRLTSAKKTFMLDCKAADLSAKTMRSYADILERFISFAGDIAVKELTPDHVRLYIADLADRPGRYAENDGKFSSHSLAKHYSVIRTWIRWLYAQKMITERITDLVKPPRLSKRLPSILSDEEVAALFEELEKEGRVRDHLIFSIWYDTGIRLDEMHLLQLQDINIDGGWIKVLGKGDKEDIVPIGTTVCRDLYKYIHLYRKPALPDEPCLFLSEHGPTRGYALGYEGLAAMARRVLTKIRKLRGKRGAHTMRHTAGTHMLRAGASTEHVRRVFRQEDNRITQMYLHLADQDLLDNHRATSPVDRRQTRSRRRQ